LRLTGLGLRRCGRGSATEQKDDGGEGADEMHHGAGA